ncbi:hypothetical protein [Brevundimonas sp.]|uniref:hypothetical protein n=1 Tax=Brevundimonas sp. TaxID=1871086 RepID=UPI0026388CF0|nr:hypothetical protein [Brevundimonas sp.]
MIHEKQARRSTIQTFRIIAATGEESSGQVFDFQWKRDHTRLLRTLSPEFKAATPTSFSGMIDGTERACWIASQMHDPRPINQLAQTLLPEALAGRAFRGDLIVQGARHWWETYWLPCPDEDAVAAAEQLSLDRLAILPSRYMRRQHGCLVAEAPDRRTDIAQLVLAIP